MRLSIGTSAPGTPGTPSDHEVIQAAIAAEEKKRQEALDKASAQSGETKWVLSFKDPQDGSRAPEMQVVHAGFATLDAEDNDSEEEARPVRMQFGGGVKKKAVCYSHLSDTKAASGTNDWQAHKAQEDSDDSEEDSESSSEYDSDDPTAELIRETKREAAAKAREDRKARKGVETTSTHETPRRPTVIDEDADLGGLTSLSGGRRLPGGGECYYCGQKGHMKGDCPKKRGTTFSGRGTGGRGNRGSRR
jgi:hypothetical protein